MVCSCWLFNKVTHYGQKGLMGVRILMPNEVSYYTLKCANESIENSLFLRSESRLFSVSLSSISTLLKNAFVDDVV